MQDVYDLLTWSPSQVEGNFLHVENLCPSSQWHRLYLNLKYEGP